MFRRFVLTALALLCGPAGIATAAHHAHSHPKVTVGVVLFDGVEVIDYAAPYEVFAQAGFEVVTISADGKPVSGMGLKVVPDHSFRSAPALDVVVMPGGNVGDARKDRALLDFLRERSAPATHVMSVCTGVEVLAEAGLLDGLKATNFHRRIETLARDFPKVEVLRDVRWADNGKIVTSSGLSSGIDTALHLVSRLRGEEVARTTALHLEYDWKPTGGFVRGKLADRYAMNIDVDWPHDADVQRLSSLGDERHWVARYRTSTALPPAELLERVAQAVAKDSGWNRESGSGTFAWTRSDAGKRVRMTVSTEDSDTASPGYELRLSIEVG